MLLSVSLLLSAIYWQLLAIMGNALIHYKKCGELFKVKQKAFSWLDLLFKVG